MSTLLKVALMSGGTVAVRSGGTCDSGTKVAASYDGHQVNCHFADSKLLVSAGISDEGYTNTSEIIDLKQSSDAWISLKELPTMLDTPLAGYDSSSIPIVCGNKIFIKVLT